MASSPICSFLVLLVIMPHLAISANLRSSNSTGAVNAMAAALSAAGIEALGAGAQSALNEVGQSLGRDAEPESDHTTSEDEEDDEPSSFAHGDEYGDVITGGKKSFIQVEDDVHGLINHDLNEALGSAKMSDRDDAKWMSDDPEESDSTEETAQSDENASPEEHLAEEGSDVAMYAGANSDSTPIDTSGSEAGSDMALYANGGGSEHAQDGEEEDEQSYHQGSDASAALIQTLRQHHAALSDGEDSDEFDDADVDESEEDDAVAEDSEGLAEEDEDSEGLEVEDEDSEGLDVEAEESDSDGDALDEGEEDALEESSENDGSSEDSDDESSLEDESSSEDSDANDEEDSDATDDDSEASLLQEGASEEISHEDDEVADNTHEHDEADLEESVNDLEDENKQDAAAVMSSVGGEDEEAAAESQEALQDESESLDASEQ